MPVRFTLVAVAVLALPCASWALTGPILPRAFCEPVSETTFLVCCLAQNREGILTPNSPAACPSMTPGQSDAVLKDYRDRCIPERALADESPGGGDYGDGSRGRSDTR